MIAAMSSQVDYALRFFQYLDLMLLFGLPLFVWYASASTTRGRPEPQPLPGVPLRPVLFGGALLGLGLLATEVVRAPAAILGMGAFELTREDLAWYLLDTSSGRAALGRLAALLFLVLALVWKRRPGKQLPIRAISITAGVALATLAWNGHAAAGDGVSGGARLAAGVVHLLAAGAWIGAIAALLGLLVVRKGRRATPLGPVLHAFALPGTIFVGLLVVTGAFHYAELLGWSMTSLFAGDYGRLMALKLALFTAMLVLAALHRWRLAPRLDRLQHEPDRPIRHLQLSIGLEGVIALLILVIVSVLGLRSPYQ